MRKLLFIFSIIFISIGYSQDKEKSTLSSWEQMQLESLPYYSFKRGIGITTPDSLYQVKIRFRMQNRFEGDVTKDNKIQYSSEIRRLRLRFDGFIKDPKFSYAIQLSFAPRDVGSGNANIIRDAIVFYRPDSHWSFGFGQTKLPGNRQRFNSSGALQLTDRSIVNAAFNIDRDFGFHGYYTDDVSNRFAYTIKAAITTGQGRNFVGETSGLSYTGRLEVYPLGRFKKGGEFFEGDLQREETPKLYFGATYHLNHKANKENGQSGKNLFEERNLHSYFVDAVLKYNGWAFMTSYMQRSVNNPITSQGTEHSYVNAGYGLDVQGSYIFPSNWELSGRYSYLTPQSELKLITPKQAQTSLGITKYFWEHNFKAQMEVSRNSKWLNQDTSSDWFLRFQVEIGI